MKSKERMLTLKWFTAITFLAALAIPLLVAAQGNPKEKSAGHHHYKLIDMGTFGGPASYFANGFDGILNNQGTAVGWADTPMPDPFPAFCFNPDCSVSHAFVWQNGLPTDLGALPGGASSQAFWISANGLIAGNSQNGEGDPLFPGWGQFRAVLWKDGQIIDLGTLEGGYESFVGNVNSRGDVVGLAMNTVPDPFNINGPGFFPTQSRAFLWQNGVMQDLGTLGGTDANAILINEGGQIVGTSYTNSTPNPTTGIPTIDPFLWKNGTMMDLGTLGGTIGNPTAFNNRGQVVGVSNLSGDLFSHPFLWTKNGGMQDLGTLGGNTGFPNWINDVGDIVGKTDLPGPLSPEDHHAVLWSHGAMIDLGTFPEDTSSNAYNVNARGQVVGTSEDRAHMLIGVGEHAFLWENGGPMVDLNTLIPADSSLQLTYAVAINNRGEIAGFGVPPGVLPEDYEFQGHAYMLVPCDENHPGLEGCDYSLVDTSTTVDVHPPQAIQSPAEAARKPQLSPAEETTRIRSMMANRQRTWGNLPRP
jgi:probable HAF family extracellular repeat protein